MQGRSQALLRYAHILNTSHNKNVISCDFVGSLGLK